MRNSVHGAQWNSLNHPAKLLNMPFNVISVMGFEVRTNLAYPRGLVLDGEITDAWRLAFVLYDDMISRITPRSHLSLRWSSDSINDAILAIRLSILLRWPLQSFLSIRSKSDSLFAIIHVIFVFCRRFRQAPNPVVEELCPANKANLRSYHVPPGQVSADDTILSEFEFSRLPRCALSRHIKGGDTNA